MRGLLGFWKKIPVHRLTLYMFLVFSCALALDGLARAEPTLVPGPITRTIELDYVVQIPFVNRGEGPVDIFLPIAQSD